MTTAARRWCARRRVGHTLRRGRRGMRQRPNWRTRQEKRGCQAVIRNVRHHKSTTNASRYMRFGHARRSHCSLVLLAVLYGTNVVDLVLLLAKSVDGGIVGSIQLKR